MELTKTLDLTDTELKVDGNEAPGTFTGYASKFNSTDLVGDTFAPGAWTKALENAGTIPIFFNHDSLSVPLGKYTKIEQNARGLKVEGQLILDIPKAQDLYAAMKAGVVSGMSVGFTLDEDGYEKKEEGGFLIKEVKALREISICTFPCETKARIVSVKSESVESMKTIRDAETVLRDSGFSKSQSLGFLSKLKVIIAEELRRESDLKAKAENADALKRLNSLI